MQIQLKSEITAIFHDECNKWFIYTSYSLAIFFVSVRKKNGENYEPGSMVVNDYATRMLTSEKNNQVTPWNMYRLLHAFECNSDIIS